jgi:aryl-alcohol dehydrogenase-like predicted oxidoreductase
MQLAGDGFFGPRSRDRDEALQVLRAAVAAGVDHIDTAQFYGAGTVNELIREALYPYPDGLAIVSKVAGRGGAELREGIEGNLVTLAAGRLAAVNLRMMDPSEPPGQGFDAQLAALARAREEGLIDGVGLSNISRRHLLRATALTEIVCVQNLFNLADQRSRDVLAECEARDIAFVPFCPLGLPGEERRRLLADPCWPPWPYGWARRQCRSRSPGCWTSPRTSCSSRAPAPASTSPRTWPPPTSGSTPPPVPT